MLYTKVLPQAFVILSLIMERRKSEWFVLVDSLSAELDVR